MKLRRSRLRLLSTLALTLGLALGGAACDKGGGSTDTPGEGGKKKGSVDGGSQAGEGGKDYVYAADGFVLTATMTIKFEISSKQGSGAAEISARSLIEATPADGGKLKIHGKVIELLGYKGSGQLEPEFMKKQAQEAGGKAVDIVEQLSKSESWLIVNQKGELDEAATKALAENQKGEDDEGADFGLFNLPDLPAVDLVEGKKITLPTKVEQRQLPFGSVPVEIDETWTLRKIDGNRIAEFDVSSEASGATEISGGGGSANVSMLEESSFTIFFNLETKLPVSFSGYSQSETSIDIEGQRETITFSTNNEITASYEPAG